MTDDVTASQQAIAREVEYYGNMNTLYFLRASQVVGFLLWLLIVLRVFAVEPVVCTYGYAASIVVWILEFAISRRLGLHHPALKWILVTMETLRMAAMATAITFHGIVLFSYPVGLAAQYANKRLSFYTYALLAVVMSVSGIIGYYVGIADFNVYFFSVLPLGGYLDAMTGLVSVEPSTLNPIISVVFYFVMPRLGLLMALYPLIKGVAKNAERSIRLNYLLQRETERDALTGLYNREKWKKAQEGYEGIDSVSVMFVDINELKYVNDTFGHETGDELIRRVARVLAQLSTERVNTYRIGGDEFVTVVESPEPGEAEELIAQVRKLVGEETLSNGRSCSVAVGASTGCGADIVRLMGDADERMLVDKREQKSKLGIKTRE